MTSTLKQGWEELSKELGLPDTDKARDIFYCGAACLFDALSSSAEDQDKFSSTWKSADSELSSYAKEILNL